MCSKSIEPSQQQQQKQQNEKKNATTPRTRRKKRDKVGTYVILSTTPNKQQQQTSTTTTTTKKKKKKQKSRALKRHGDDGSGGGMQALLPSFIGVVILACGVMAKMGFRGRAHVAGIDLGTTNSVICVQAPSKGVGIIDCIPDPTTNSSIIPSVVSFLEPEEYLSTTTKKQREMPSQLSPHPSQVVVGSKAKKRIETHPHHTLYHAKRALGRSYKDVTQSLGHEVEFQISKAPREDETEEDSVVFNVPIIHDKQETISISPQHVGSYVIHHLIQITSTFLGHSNVQSAVICVPAKFDARARRLTVEAFKEAGVSVTRIVEEPTAAALAYGLHKKENVEYILVYDFGGGTLDVSLLHVSDGYVEVMGSDGDDVLGGSDFDAVIAKELLQRDNDGDAVERTKQALDSLGVQEDGLQCKRLLTTVDDASTSSSPLCTHASFHTMAERLKIELSSFPDGEDGVAKASCWMVPPSTTSISSMTDFCNSLELATLQLSSRDMHSMVAPLYERSVVPIRRLLQDLNVQTEEVDEVVMVGGTTRMPHIRTLVQEEMKAVDQLNTHIDPDITVAYGAASVID